MKANRVKQDVQIQYTKIAPIKRYVNIGDAIKMKYFYSIISIYTAFGAAKCLILTIMKSK